MAAFAPTDQLVTLDVGGTLFKTRLSTLTRFPGSALAAMVCGSARDAIEVDGQAKFIDRNPKHFARVLDFMRDGAVVLPESRCEQQELRREAEYFGLEDLLAALEDAEEEWKKKQAALDEQQEAEAYLTCQRAEVAREAAGKLAAAAAAQSAAQQQLAELEPQRAGESAELQDHMQRAMDASLTPAQRQDAKSASRACNQRIKVLQEQMEEAQRCLENAWKEAAEARTLRLAALGISLPSAAPLAAAATAAAAGPIAGAAADVPSVGPSAQGSRDEEVHVAVGRRRGGIVIEV